MRAVWLAVAAVAIGLPGRLGAQEPPPLPPLPPGPPQVPALPGGTEVSRPLTPVELPPLEPLPVEPVPDAKPEAVRRVEAVQEQKAARRGPLGPDWDDYSVLLWWPKAHPVPPLVTATRSGAPPVPGGPDTILLVGNRSLGTPDVAGGRFVLGSSLNEAQTLGFELAYFFLGSRTLKNTASAFGNPRVAALGLPYVNALTGQQDVFPTAAPGVAAGSVYTTTTTRVQGAEANFVANLIDNRRLRLNGLLGYRYFQVQEGLTVEQFRQAGGVAGTIYDEFDAHNRFNGGQLGLHADISLGVVYCELTGKVALGQTFEVVRIDGATAIGGYVPGGVYALPSNIGRYTRSMFAVVPEGIFKVGVKLSDSGRFYVGYNFIYLSDAVRPGDQIDRTLNPANIPSLNPAGGFVPPDRPRPLLTRSEFWAQGLVFGLETRY
jgi:hypothetical protein